MVYKENFCAPNLTHALSEYVGLCCITANTIDKFSFECIHRHPRLVLSGPGVIYGSSLSAGNACKSCTPPPAGPCDRYLSDTR